MMMTLAEGNSLESAAQSFVQKYQLTVTESKKDNINGLPAILVVADQKQEQQQQQQAQVRVLLSFIQHGGNIYALLGATSANDFKAYLNTFQSSIGSFAVLTDPSKLNRQPERIRVKEVPQGGTLAQAFKSFNVKENRMEELATLNGMTLQETVSKGRLIKVIE
jgi:predicted Zn-dependent protease